MADAVIRLDKSKEHSECRGERTPDDPLYRVHWWQGQRVGRDHVLLPFDSQGLLVPDDGRMEPFQGIVENKPVTYMPLYSPAMRRLLQEKLKRITGPAKAAAADDTIDNGAAAAEEAAALDDVNFGMWLRGEATYEWSLLQKAGKKRFSRVFSNKKQMVEDLVLDEKVVTENEVCADLIKHLPAKP